MYSRIRKLFISGLCALAMALPLACENSTQGSANNHDAGRLEDVVNDCVNCDSQNGKYDLPEMSDPVGSVEIDGYRDVCCDDDLDVGYRDPTAFCVVGYDWDEEKLEFVIHGKVMRDDTLDNLLEDIENES